MNVEIARRTRHSMTWKDELAQLLTQPVVLSESVYREGESVGLWLSPQPTEDGGTVDLSIRFFPLHLSLSTTEDSETDPAALAVFLQGLQDPDVPVRLTACEALGQLGNPAARSALENALQDDDPLLRIAAERALTALDAPRIRAEDCAGLRLFLWRQVQHLWKPLGAAITNRRGEARFPQLLSEGGYRLQLLDSSRLAPGVATRRPSLRLVAEQLPDEEFLPDEGMAAGAFDAQFPQSQRLMLEDGSLTCTLCQNDEGAPVLEFRSEAPSLKGGSVYFTVTRQGADELVLDGIVTLLMNAQKILTGSVVLENRLEPTHSYEISFDPVPAPQLDES
jgi:hypothetical protein